MKTPCFSKAVLTTGVIALLASGGLYQARGTAAESAPDAEFKAFIDGYYGAWTTVTCHLSLKQKDGNTVEVDGRHTAIWEKRRDEWLIVHEHLSPRCQARAA